MPARDQIAILAVEAGALVCALPLEHVIETMRPLPIEPLGGGPECLLGIARVRGVACPVLALSALLGRSAPAEVTRFVSLRTGERSVVLAVERVLEIRRLARSEFQALPPLLSRAHEGLVQTIAELDQRLMFALSAAHLCPREVASLTSGEAH